ncbi:hypothetical protein PMAYCL1PPCAC_18090, partial [Pristionchus mayeri]
SAFSKSDAEVIKLKISNKLMDEEILRLQPELKKYENCAHPAARPVHTEAVSTSSLAEKTKVIKQDTSNLKATENELSDINDRVTSLFSDVETKVAQRDFLFSEIEQATSMLKSLTIGSSHFEEDSDAVRKKTNEESNLLISKTRCVQNRMKGELSKLAGLKKNHSNFDRVICVRQQRSKVAHDRKADCESKVELDLLAETKTRLGLLVEKTASVNDYIISLTNAEGLKTESLRSTITECEKLKQQKIDLVKQLEEVQVREEIIVSEKDEKAKQMEESQRKMDELTIKKEQLLKNHELLMAEMKESCEPLVESLKMKKDSVLQNLEVMRLRIENREECLRLRRDLEAEGNGEALDFTEEMKSLKHGLEDTRANITKVIGKAEYYQLIAARFYDEVNELQVSHKRKREGMERKLHEKDGVANHFEMEVYNLKKKLEREKVERDDRLATETRRLLEKAKEDKERKEREEKRRIEKEKEKIRKSKEEEEKKRRRAIEDQAKKHKEEREKKKQENAKKRMMDAVQNKNATSVILAQVQQRRMNMESAASTPFTYSDGSLLNSFDGQASQSGINLRSRSAPKKSMFIFDDDSSEDDDDDMSDFLLDDSSRVMPKVPEKYAGSPPRVDKQKTPLNPFELSFADVESSTPVRQRKSSKQSSIPTPALEISFNQVVTSTPEIQRRSKTNKKQTRLRGKKKTK